MKWRNPVIVAAATLLYCAGANCQSTPTMGALQKAHAAAKERDQTRTEVEKAAKSPLLSSIFDNLGVLDPLKLDFKVIDARNGAQSIGSTFNYTVNETFFDESHLGRDVSHAYFELSAKGTVAFDSAVNPEDLLVGKVRLGYRRHLGMASGEAVPDMGSLAPRFAHGNDTERAKIIQDLAEHDTGSPELLDFRLDLNAGIESNQRFSERNSTYGLSLYLKPTFLPSSSLAGWNFFDWPFYLTRVATKYSGDAGNHSVSGIATPAIQVALDDVTPEGMDPRAMLGDASTYQRVSINASMRTGFAKVGDQRFTIDLNYRYYQEIDASSAVKGAGLDGYDYFAVGIEQEDGGFFVTYRTGKLPFDQRDNNAVEMGWHFTF